jgi:hypothetical protein
MSEFTTRDVMEGYVKDIYDKIVDPIPKEAQIVGDIGFKSGAKELGNQLVMDVQISDEGGFTHSASEDAFTINDAISMQTKKALVDGYSIMLSGKIPYVMAARASSSRKAFREIVGHKMENMVSSAKKRLACEMMHGQIGLGIIESATLSSADAICVITESTWAPAIWQGKADHLVWILNAANTALPTSVTGAFTVKSCNVATRTVTFTEVVAGDAADLVTWVGSNPSAANVHWYGTVVAGPTWATMAGIVKIASNTTATLFNIAAATVDVWQGNTYACGSAPLTLSKIMKAAGQVKDRGASGNLKLYCSNRTWENIFTDQAALRRYGAEIRDLKLGGKGISVAYQDTSIQIVGDGFCKQGEALLLEVDKWERIGAQDLSFKTPGAAKGEEIFLHDPTKAGFGYRYFGHQAVFCEMPSHQLVFTGIVNT